MKLTVDLACSKCYKKAKKAIRKFPREFHSTSLNYIVVENGLNSINNTVFWLICKNKNKK